jgi:type IV pilus assembly protein PilY1
VSRPFSAEQILKLVAVIVAMLAVLPMVLADGVNIANQPLTVAEPVPPNIFYILDDSGSMNRDDMPNSINCSDNSGGTENVIQPNGKLRREVSARCQSPDFNKLYYNPSFTYAVPVGANGAALVRNPANTFTHAYLDGYSTSTDYVDLSQWRQAWQPYAGTDRTSVTNATSGLVCSDRARSGSGYDYVYSKCQTATTENPLSGYRLTNPGILWRASSTSSVTNATSGFICASSLDYSNNVTLYFQCATASSANPRSGRRLNSPYHEVWQSDHVGSVTSVSAGFVCNSRTGSSSFYAYYDCAEATSASTRTGYLLSSNERFSYYLYKGSGDTADDTSYEKRLATDSERQNVANWYAYYRNRLYTAKAGTSLAFSGLPSNYRLGYGSINATGTKVQGVKAFSTAKTEFYPWLLGKDADGGTPLRRALDHIGQYYSQAEPWLVNPSDTSSQELACRLSFSILMTDGYWSEGTSYQATTDAARADNDSINGPTITGTNNSSYTYSATDTFRDGYSNTLADVAMYYWKRDLRVGLSNSVPVSDTDPAFWQHMVTLGIGLGVEGTKNISATFDALATGGAISWLDPTDGDNYKIDDLLHAAINSRGYFFSAKSPQEFLTGLKQSLTNIQARLATGNSLAIDSATLAEGSILYKAIFKSVIWSGEVAAYALDANGNQAGTPNWLASTKLPAFGSRNIYTRVDDTATAFTWANLNTTQKTAIGSETILNYLRGDQSQEVAKNGSLRTRNSPLGDIVNSSPVYVGSPDPYLVRNRSWPEANTHDDFAAAQASRAGMVYVGANDGMLHGFNAATGVETFAYLPSSLVNATLASLANPEYEHRYFMDGELTAADAYVGGAWKTLLVGSLGRGGKTLFGIDVTQPASISTTKMLWEVSPSSMGQNLGKPLIGRLPGGTWAAIVGNGYNSSNHQATLLVVNLANGSVTSIGTGVGSALDPNGLAGAYLWDANGDGNFETAYAGDLKGNVWRFDLVGNTATKLFQALDASSQPQPITSSVRVSKDPETLKTWVFFGTGKYLGSADPDDRQIQTWYGLIDDQSTISGRSALVQRPILADTVVGSITARTISEAVAGDLIGKRGWYIDLAVDGAAQGERMVLPNQIVGASSLLGVSLIPIGDTCNPGGTGFIMVINPFTGGRLGYSFFDYSGDGVINATDLVGGVPGSGINFKSIPSNPVFKGNKMIVQTDQGQVHTMTVAPPYPFGETQRVMWREIADD